MSPDDVGPMALGPMTLGPMNLGPMPPAPVGAVTGPGREFFDRARRRLTLEVPAALCDPTAPATRGDLDLDPAAWERAGVVASRPAAVLIPVVDRETPTVILTLRTADLASHAGQIAFPGGKIEPDDESPLGAALREAEEEIGLAPALVEPLGYLDLYLTFSGFRILPTLARVAPAFALNLNASEVSEVFEVPLAFLMGPENHQRHSRDWKGITRQYYAMTYQDRYIWGVTAGILRNLYERIYGE
jgi:8-oxo-dGTP pyrophosphatase MutT (NUDIX family)